MKTETKTNMHKEHPIFVTFRKKTTEGTIHRAIPCGTIEEARDRAMALSFVPGLRNIGINQCGTLQKGTHILKAQSA